MRIRSAIANIGTYKPPLEGRNPKEYLLMDFNESPEPPPPSVRRALQECFCEELGQYVGVSAEQLLLTNGSDQGIDVVLRCLLEPGTNLVMAMPGFTPRAVATAAGPWQSAVRYRKACPAPHRTARDSPGQCWPARHS